MQNNDTGNILICGSQNFNDREFVMRTLDTYYLHTNGNISGVFTSRFSGACEIAREWVCITNDFFKEHGHNERLIKHDDCTFDMELAKKNSSFYEDTLIPEFVLQNDPFFVRGKEQIIEHGVNNVLCFPNAQGVLGPSTHNIFRFANLAGIKPLDCADLYQQILQARMIEENKSAAQVIVEHAEESNKNQFGFKNKHPGKKF